MSLPASFALQKRLAAKILNCGWNKVKLNPYRLKEIGEARSPAKVRTLLTTGAIRRVSKNERWQHKIWKPPGSEKMVKGTTGLGDAEDMTVAPPKPKST